MSLFVDDVDFKLYVGDVREQLRELPDESVHCVVTSPPYWGLRDYGTEGQLGLEATPELFVQSMVDVFQEVRRVLRRDGTCWVNLGDSYVVCPSAATAIATSGRNHMSNSAKAKGDRAELEVQGWFRDVLGVPARRALGAGRLDDMGDMHGIPETVVSVANYADLDRAVRDKLPALERQRQTAGAQFAAMFCRRRGGSFVVVMTPEQFAALWREAA